MALYTDEARENGQQKQRPVLHESKRVDYGALLRLGRELLQALGEDPDREGLRDTPRRWADSWREFIEYEPGVTDTCFSSVSTDQMVCVSGLRVYSMCEHHLMPFWCDVAIGYIAGDQVLGLSKFARIAHQFAHQLQLQERLGEQIADEVSRITGTPDVAVVLKGEHLCMVSRGIRTPGIMTSSVMRGVFRAESETRLEFLRLIGS
ncbi:GTP cyclohydrolase I [Thermosporothrix hazakensis]|jgi:GTP cyclohydrolase I|uniref:GTP cyclohydrolase I n=2 Tax=Thermosporothrix TaxID=768650 RepID=A0A326U576_THEHA|nr:GTP cyclohydrolase I [Thermosporothrix hazakensis]PZW27485.1 GTP cyclohydrolase I [Thermosporothrix hazakensis]BBH85922.1 GTP cyclohydrolase 1 [Thermosporothrix sp. COM3]GCE45651.1 GTP cyclohydrolase 1 [Thermosporothrix hazakensis]